MYWYLFPLGPFAPSDLVFMICSSPRPPQFRSFAGSGAATVPVTASPVARRVGWWPRRLGWWPCRLGWRPRQGWSAKGGWLGWMAPKLERNCFGLTILCWWLNRWNWWDWGRLLARCRCHCQQARLVAPGDGNDRDPSNNDPCRRDMETNIDWRFKVAKIRFKSSDVCPESCARACVGVFECKAVERASRALGAGLDPETNLSEVWTCWKCNWQPGSVALMAQGWLWWCAWVPLSPRLFVWQAWHLATSTFTLLGRRGTYGTGLALVARLVLVCRRCRRSCLCGKRGTWGHRPSLCVAGVARMALGWLWWRAWVPFAPGGRCSCLCGRRGTWWHRPSLCVAGVALGDIGFHFVCHPYLVTCSIIWRGRRCTWCHRHALCVAGVGLGDIQGWRGFVCLG